MRFKFETKWAIERREQYANIDTVTIPSIPNPKVAPTHLLTVLLNRARAATLPNYASAADLSVLAAGQQSAATGFIDKQGKMVFSLPFDTVTGFVNGVSRVLVGIKSGYIDKPGKYIWQPSN